MLHIKIYPWLFNLVIALGASCHSPQPNTSMENELQILYNKNEFAHALSLIKSVKYKEGTSFFVDSLNDYIQRYYLEFPLTRKDIDNELEKRGIGFAEAQLAEWENKGYLEYKVIDGEKRYFKNTVYNLFLLDDSLRRVSGYEGLNEDSLNKFCKLHIEEVLSTVDRTSASIPICPVEMVLKYFVKMENDFLPEGEVVSAWLPFGVRNFDRQRDVNLMRSIPHDAVVSSADCAHQSVYLKKKVQQNDSIYFSETVGLTSYAQYFDPVILKQAVLTDLPDSVQQYTHERLPHISFSHEIRSLADSLTTPQMGPYEMVKQFYYWIDENIPWASAIEYGLIDNIPQYTIQKGHGDCGMQTLLFMTLCRYKGIAARWQSGWMLHPGHVNLHDWCEVWYNGIGWVPVDVSFKLQDSDDKRIKEFYISGIDSYRFIVNRDYGQFFSPEKKWPRSEPWDFQRGELEWGKGNIYFNNWEWDMKVSYLPD